MKNNVLVKSLCCKFEDIVQSRSPTCKAQEHIDKLQECNKLSSDITGTKGRILVYLAKHSRPDIANAVRDW